MSSSRIRLTEEALKNMSTQKWKKYINHILDNYPRHTALQEEFKNICF